MCFFALAVSYLSNCDSPVDISGMKKTECAGMQIKTFKFENNERLSLSKVY